MGHQLLIIDDDTNIQKMLKTVLECEHFSVTVASDGRMALHCLEKSRPDLILLDLMMPNLDGRSFVQELEHRGLRSAIPVLVLTANVYAQPLIEDMRVAGWLTKPFRLAELVRQIRKLLE